MSNKLNWYLEMFDVKLTILEEMRKMSWTENKAHILSYRKWTLNKTKKMDNRNYDLRENAVVSCTS